MIVDFIKRSGAMTAERRLLWIQDCLKEAGKIDATWVRVSMHPKNKDLWVFEACKEFPESEDLPDWEEAK